MPTVPRAVRMHAGWPGPFALIILSTLVMYWFSYLPVVHLQQL